MSNPYSSQSISGYNASPPPDDGSQTTANQITWAKHKTKLADPVKTLAEGINSAVSTAFGRIFLNSAVSKSTDYTVTESDQGKLINVTNTTTITLPASGSVGPNFTVTVRNAGAGTVTVDGNSSELINGSVTQTLPPSYWSILTADGNGWYSLTMLPDGITATTAEINVLDGMTSTTAELNLLDGVTATTAELNRVDGTTGEVKEKLEMWFGKLTHPTTVARSGSGTAWTATNPATGTYTITHNLGTASIAPVCIPFSASVPDAIPTITAIGTNSFTVTFHDASATTLVDTDFIFMVSKL